MLKEWIEAGVQSRPQSNSRTDHEKVAEQQKEVWTKVNDIKSQFTVVSRDQETQTARDVLDKTVQTSHQATSVETQTGDADEPTWTSLLQRLKECVQTSLTLERREMELFAEFWEYWKDDSCPIPAEAHYWAEQIGNRESDLQEIRKRRKSRADKKKYEKEVKEARKKDLEKKRQAKIEKEMELEKEKEKLKEAKEKIRKLEEEAAKAQRDELFADKAVKDTEARSQYRQGRERRCSICDYPGVIKGNWCPNR